LFDIDTGASDELSFVIRQSFKDCCYTPSTAMEEAVADNVGAVIVSGVVVKNEIINIDSD
jgi:hypothetical protein